MRHLVLVGVATLALWMSLSGCAQHHCSTNCDCCPNSTPTGPGPDKPENLATLDSRGKLPAPNLASIPSHEELAQSRPAQAEPAQYCELKADQCQCLAAAHSTMGNLLDSESQLTGSGGKQSRGHQKAESSLRRDLQAYRAADERNRSAAHALRAFYLLAEAEANRPLLEKSLQQANHAVESLRQLKATGLQVATDERTLERQKLDLVDQNRQLQTTIPQLNGQLRSLLGFEASDERAIWPAADLTVSTAPIDVEAAVSEGLKHRADVGMVQTMRDRLNADTLSAVRSAMQLLDPLLGGGGGVAHLLFSHHKKPSEDAQEVETRRKQLEQLNADRRAAGAEEIRQKARDVELRLQQVALAKETRDLWQQQVERLRQRREADGVTAFDISKAQLEAFRAESELLHKVVAWKIAQVELKEAQGLLAWQCGYRPPGGGGGSRGESCR